MRRIRSHLTYANITATLSLFLVLGGGTALASYVISSNSQVGPATISGHEPPSGDHANIIGGTVNAQDVTNESLGSADIKNRQVRNVDLAPLEALHKVRPASSTQDLCAGASNVGVFCSFNSHVSSEFGVWQNYGSPYATAAFYKDQLGIVHLKGVVQANDMPWGSHQVPVQDTLPHSWPIFRLPTAYRPAGDRVFGSDGRALYDSSEVAPARIDVHADGLVVLWTDCNSDATVCTDGGNLLSLDGISFRRDG